MSAYDAPVQIPGYRVERQLGRGGMATVYLAVQHSVEREVALKIMAPQLSADPTFGERFLREARIAAKLHHRHVVSIYDVGVHEGVHYCAMEYLPGGPVMRRNGPPLALRPTLRCVREIAGALHYAQQKGFIHRDVKPDNILLREDGSSVLSDFGIARAADSGTMMTKTGSVVGTPHYMSPEQLRGRAIDGRADLYSLGVVFYQLLTGKVPYEASDSLAVGIMHMTAPLPQLPAEYRVLQPILERMMAKEPIDRFQTGWEIEQALLDVEARLGEKGIETLLPMSRQSSPAEPVQPTPVTLRSPHRGQDSLAGTRTEPQLGRVDDLAEMRLDGSRRRGVAPVPQATRIWPWMMALTLLALLALGWSQREPIRQHLLAQLQPAPVLTQGEQEQPGDPPGSADPGTDPRPQAEPSSEPLAAPPPADPPAEDPALRAAREQAEAEAHRAVEQQQGIARLLAEAEALGRRGRWIEPAGQSAADRYLAVLALDAASVAARQGFDGAIAQGQKQLEAALEKPDLALSQRLLARLRTLAPRAPGLAALRDRVERAAEAARRPSPEQQELHDRLIREGEAALAADTLLEPPGDAAYDKFRGAMGIDRQSAAAKAGLDALAARLRQRIEQSLAAGRVTRAHGDLEGLGSVNASDPAIPALRRRVARAYAERGLELLANDRIAGAREDLERAESLDAGDEEVRRLRQALQGR